MYAFHEQDCVPRKCVDTEIFISYNFHKSQNIISLLTLILVSFIAQKCLRFQKIIIATLFLYEHFNNATTNVCGLDYMRLAHYFLKINSWDWVCSVIYILLKCLLK